MGVAAPARVWAGNCSPHVAIRALAAVLVALAVLGAWPGRGLAQTPIFPPFTPTTGATPPIRSVVNNQHVDLADGTYSYATQEVSIGQPGAGGLAYGRSYVGGALGWFAWTDAAVYVSSFSATVAIGGSADSFTRSGLLFTSATGDGATLIHGSAWTYTNSAGVAYSFSTTYVRGTPPCQNGSSGNCVAQLQSITYPNGEIDTYNYETETNPSGGPCTVSGCSRLLSITNNLGYQLKLTYASNTLSVLSDLQPWWTVVSVMGINNAIDYCAPTAETCSGFTQTWPVATYAVSGSTQTVTDTLGRVTTYTFDSTPRLVSIARPSGATTTISYNTSGEVSATSNGIGTWTYAYSLNTMTNVLTVTSTDPNSNARVVAINATTSLMNTDTDALSNVTSYTYDSFGRVTQTSLPEGNEIQLAYDGRGNILTQTAVPVSGSGLSNIVTSGAFDSTCTYPAKCNKPNTTTDGNGNVTTYTYDNTHGFTLTTTGPPPTTGAVAPVVTSVYSAETAYYYQPSGGSYSLQAAPSAVYKLTSAYTCATTASCSGTADQVLQTIAYSSSGAANNLLPISVSKGSGSGSLTATVALTFTPQGDLATVNGPLSGSVFTTTYLYDKDREQVGVIAPDPDGSGPLLSPAQRTSYTADGLVAETEVGTVPSPSSWSSFNSLSQEVLTYDIADQKISDAATSAGVTQNLTQFSYDAGGRVTCSVVRMNQANFGAAPASACTLAPNGANGDDRVTHNSYDADNHLTQVTQAYGTSAAYNYVTSTYGANGEVLTVKDAQNNLTTTIYDGFVRASKVEFPSTTQGAGTSDPTDYESYVYDSNSNVTTRRMRSGNSLTFTYDTLSRLSVKHWPTGGGGSDVYYTYDLLNRTLSATYGSTSGAGVSATYDALSRELTETSGGLTMTFAYDLAGNRTRITWPDTFYAGYAYDNDNRLTTVNENGAVSGVGVLANYAFGSQLTLTGVTRGNGASTSYAYDSAFRLNSIAQSFTSSSANVTFGLAYNAANLALNRSSSNDLYTGHPGNLSTAYTANGLNQYGTVGGATFTYDSQGNMTSDGTRTFTYDIENHLLSETGGPAAATFTYDPLGRMQTSTASSATTTYLRAGDQLVAEYNGSAVLRRYVPGANADQPVVWYEGSGTASRRWLHTDQLGSVVGWSDSTGASNATYTYDPYGNPGSWSGSRYSYTGQLMIPEAALYYYKSRVYDPASGRFLQTDPIGYQSDINMYAYVRNDPLNFLDPSGLDPSDTIVTAPPPCPAGQTAVREPSDSPDLPGRWGCGAESGPISESPTLHGPGGVGRGGAASPTPSPRPMPKRTPCDPNVVRWANAIYKAGGVVSKAGGGLVALGAGTDEIAAAVAATGVGAPAGAAAATAGTAVAAFGGAGVVVGAGTQIISGAVLWQQTGNYHPFLNAITTTGLGKLFPINHVLDDQFGDAAGGLLDSASPEAGCPGAG